MVLAVAGRSGAGKTTLLCRLIAELKRRGRTAAVVKHCGSGFDLGGRGKDSSRFFAAGAESVVLIGPKGTASLRKAAAGRLNDREPAAGGCRADFVFIEGARIEPGIPVIDVVGGPGIDRAPVRERDRWIVVAARPVRTGKPVFSPDDIEEIAEAVERLAEKARPGSLEERFFDRHDPAVRSVLRTSAVGIAGAGGLGSNAALALARSGVGTLIIADFDRIEASNLNRQAYFADQVGRFKVEALAETIGRIPSPTKVIARKIRLTSANAACVFEAADILVEALDRADQKQMLIEAWMSRFPGRPVIAASGLAGYGSNNRLRERRIGLLTLIGDAASEATPENPPMGPRVAIVAAMQANRVVECLMNKKKRA